MIALGPARMREVASFLTVGAAAFVVQLVLLNVLISLGLGALPANAIATSCSIAVAYAGNRRWSFARRAGPDLRREMTAFVVVNAVTLAVSEGLLVLGDLVGASHDRLTVNALIVLGVGVGTVLRYVGYTTIVFTADVAVRGRGGPIVGRASDEQARVDARVITNV